MYFDSLKKSKHFTWDWDGNGGGIYRLNKRFCIVVTADLLFVIVDIFFKLKSHNFFVIRFYSVFYTLNECPELFFVVLQRYFRRCCWSLRFLYLRWGGYCVLSCSFLTLLPPSVFMTLVHLLPMYSCIFLCYIWGAIVLLFFHLPVPVSTYVLLCFRCIPILPSVICPWSRLRLCLCFTCTCFSLASSAATSGMPLSCCSSTCLYPSLLTCINFLLCFRCTCFSLASSSATSGAPLSSYSSTCLYLSLLTSINMFLCFRCRVFRCRLPLLHLGCHCPAVLPPACIRPCSHVLISCYVLDVRVFRCRFPLLHLGRHRPAFLPPACICGSGARCTLWHTSEGSPDRQVPRRQHGQGVCWGGGTQWWLHQGHHTRVGDGSRLW